MLNVFIDELGDAYFDYAQQTSKVLMSLTNYSASDSIRTSSVSALPGLVKCIKAKQGGVTADLMLVAKEYNANIIASMKEETETDCLCTQVAALKEIISECGQGLMQEAEVHELGDYAIRIINKSLDRIKELDEIKEEEPEDEDDVLDKEDLALLKEEGKNEYDLQLAAAELLGILFKTHRAFVAQIVNTLRTETLHQAFVSGVQKRLKFGLFVLDDMVEHLGPEYFAPDQYMMIV